VLEAVVSAPARHSFSTTYTSLLCGSGSTGSTFLALLDPDPDPLFRDMDPDPSIIKQKKKEKPSFLLFYDFFLTFYF
jgi:hypothetical protein